MSHSGEMSHVCDACCLRFILKMNGLVDSRGRDHESPLLQSNRDSDNYGTCSAERTIHTTVPKSAKAMMRLNHCSRWAVSLGPRSQ